MLSENRRVSPVQEATYDGEGPEELLLTIGRRPRETHVRLGSKADVGPPLRLCPLYPRKRTSSDAMGMSALCNNVWPGHAVQDGLPLLGEERSCNGRRT